MKEPLFIGIAILKGDLEQGAERFHSGGSVGKPTDELADIATIVSRLEDAIARARALPDDMFLNGIQTGGYPQLPFRSDKAHLADARSAEPLDARQHPPHNVLARAVLRTMSPRS